MAAKKTPKTDPMAAALQSAMDSIAKDFGDEALQRMGDAPRRQVEPYPTGVLAYDQALGIGGFARGRIVEVYGNEGSGKTTLTLHAIAETQRNGGLCAFIDAEHALDPDYAQAIGVDTDSLLLSQPDYGEQGLEIASRLAKSGAVSLIVVDSVAALIPRSEIEGEIGDQHVGRQARMMSQALRTLAGSLNRSHTTILFINQIREKIGVKFGSPLTTPGGRALKFYASQRVEVARIQTLKKGEEAYGTRVQIKVVKNKVASPFKKATATNIFGLGLDREANLITLAADHGIFKKSGSWFKYQGENFANGEVNAREHLLEHPEMTLEVELLVKQAMGIIPADDEVVEGGVVVDADGRSVDKLTGELVDAK